ncbi:methyltransferase domain-containing protein [Reinekea forsetii]|nr:methyltransferase domain-containing protein [Reinekea forsetii]
MAFVSFDSLVDRFSDNIYGTRKGRLRMRLIDALYQQYLPENKVTGSSVIDAAGGLGQMTMWFHAQGAQHIDYFDVSKEMVQRVCDQFLEPIAQNRINAEVASIVNYQPNSPADFVNVHAVLEWLEDPYSVLDNIVHWVKPGGYLGLMVYNKHMLMLRHLMRGTMAKAMSGDIRGAKGGLTPISALNPQEVESRLIASGFEIITQAGIRSFSDLAEKTVIDWYQEDEVFEAELELCEQRPYCDLARYILFIAKRPN